MPENQNKSKLKKFYNTLEDQPIDPSDPYYYPFLQESDSDPITELATRISFSLSESVNLFSGQRGCGKSTEFRRLKQMLEADDCEVFLLDMREYMNLTTVVEISDFLVSIMIALSDDVEKRYQTAPADRGYLERFTDFLKRDVQLDKVGIKTEAGSLTASLKDDPTFKQLLQKSLQGHTAKIVSEAHKFAQDTVQLIRKISKNEDKKVVLLIDTVEQIRGVGADGSIQVHKSVENLFSGHAASLQIPMLHIVYTIPPYLPALAPGLGRLLGGTLVYTLPSIHVQNNDNTLDSKGLEIMRELIIRRYPHWQDVFSEEQVNNLAIASGGDLRDFFRLLRTALVKATSIPIDNKTIENSLNQLRREMLPIANEDKQWLQKIADNKKANLEAIDKLPNLARFFDTNLVLNYRNGDDWYDVHPLLKKEINE